MTLLFLSPGLFFSDSAEWVFENQLGAAVQLNSPLTVRQDGEEDISLTAQWETRSFEMPPYWSMRTGMWKADSAWELELIHLKIFLKNKPDTISRFNISHGHNLLYLNRAFRRGERSKIHWNYRFGVGLTISHPEVTIRGVSQDETGGLGDLGYQVNGLAAQGTVQGIFPLFSSFHFSTELKGFLSYSHVRLDNGSASLPLVGIQALFGVGYRF